MAQPTDWNTARHDGRYAPGHVQGTKKVKPPGPMARGSAKVTGKTQVPESGKCNIAAYTDRRIK